MNTKRIAMAIALAVTISFGLAPMASHAKAELSTCAQHLDTAAAPISPGAQCIPCSPKKPCVNPLTVCSYNGSTTHGCCLGYAGQN